MRTAETPAEIPAARELRAQMRAWRRGRAELKITEVFSDAYVALFTLAMVAALGGNVVLSLRRLADDTCVAACGDVRSAAPWLVALATALATLALARLLGPVFSPPAANGWLLSTPVDRGELLRPGWWRATAITLTGAGAVLILPAMLSGFGFADGAALMAVGGASALACVGIAALSQIHEHRAARWCTWLVTLALWILLGLAATRHLGGAPTPSLSTESMTAASMNTESMTSASLAIVLTIAAGIALVAALLVWRARVDVAAMSRRVLAHTENVSPSLSGALSSLDLGLMFDVLLARRWGPRARVHTRTGGPQGWMALAHRDLLRAGRTPQPFVLLAGLVLVPYAAAEADVGRAVVLATTLVGLLAGPALCSGMRVVMRTQGLARMLAMGRKELILAHLVVPGTALMLFSIATAWTLPAALPPGESAVLVIACGLSTIASTVRWVTGKPPNYGAPLVSTPMGGLPPGLSSSVSRGFDVWAVTALPLMFGPVGVLVSMAISLTVMSYLLSESAD